MTHANPLLPKEESELLKLATRTSTLLTERLSESEPSRSPGEISSFSKDLVFSLLLISFCQKKIRLPEFSSLQLSDPDVEQSFEKLYPLFLGYDRFFSSNIFSHPLRYDLSPDRDACLELYDPLLTAGPLLTPETIGLLYEKFVCPHDNKKEGIFYTPQPVVKEIVDKSISAALKSCPAADLPELAVLDPACGSGIFLLEAFRYLTQLAGRKGTVSHSDKSEILSNCIFGVDKDPQAVAITKLVLQLALFEERQLTIFDTTALPNLSGNIHVGNSLLSPADFDLRDSKESELMNLCSALSWEEAFPAIFEHRGFDCIIGNPPYGLSRDQQISAAENKKLKKIYQNFRSGKVNKYLLFMARCYQLLAEQGVMSFIVPNSWLGIRAGKLLRRTLLEDKVLSSVLVYDCPVFDLPSVETVVFRVIKNSRSRQITISRTNGILPDSPRESFKISTQLCLKNPEYTIPVIWADDCEEIINHLLENSIPLGTDKSPFIPAIALQAYAQGKGDPPQTAEDVKNHIFHTESKEDETAIPYLEGSDIQRYELSWSGKYLKHGPWLAEPQSLDRFTCPRLLLREIINPPPYILIACYTAQPFLYNKSVLHITTRPEVSEDQVLALLAILNSKLASFCIRFRGRKSQRRLFPKIVNADLKDFPLPRLFDQHYEKLANLVRIMTTAQSPSQQDLIDQAVFEAYQLPDCLISGLNKSLKTDIA